MKLPTPTLLVFLVQTILAAPGDGDWASAYTRANASLARLSNTEKVAIVTGGSARAAPCVGSTGAAASIGFRSLCLMDGPLGVRGIAGITAFPAGIHTGSTWDVELMNARGLAMGQEARGLGINILLGPVGGPLGKIPTAGRNWEGFSNDPYLSGVAMAETIDGMQAGGVQANAKHLIGNEQERNRQSQSANIDDRTTHELYLWPFADAVKANVASVMCSYNRVNTTYACENSHLLNGLLKDELDFQGFVVSDWGAQHTTAGSANGGLDMTMPDGRLWGTTLTRAISSGQVPQSRLDDMVLRILAAWYFTGQDTGYPAPQGSNGGLVGPDVQGDHRNVARAIARDGIVLLKNVGGALPLRRPRSLAIIGQDAIVNPNGANACRYKGCNTGTLAMGWGSGTADFPYLIAPLDAIRAQAVTDGTTIVTSTTDTPADGARAAASAETAIVFITSDAGEAISTVEGSSGDRLNLDPWHNGNDLVRAVAAVSQRVIVVVHSVGPVTLETIEALPSVVAIVWAGLPGQESGNGLADILYGSTSPSGKLPYTIARQFSDYGADIAAGDDNYSEGLFIDYRHFDRNGIVPRYEFGFGLSYTTFSYSALTTSRISASSPSTIKAPGGLANLYDIVATVTATITNNGTVSGAEVAQLYIGLPSSAPATPIRQLRGFQKLSLAPGQSRVVTFGLRRKDLSFWDTARGRWVLPTGSFGVWVGASSRDLRLTGTLSA